MLFYVGFLGALVSCGVILANGNLDVLNFRVVPVVGLVAFASWRILQEDLEDYKISNLKLNAINSRRRSFKIFKLRSGPIPLGRP
jgi:hypothetical protein